MTCVAKSELVAGEKDHPVTVNKYGQGADEANHRQSGAAHQERGPRAVSVRPVYGGARPPASDRLMMILPLEPDDKPLP
jgi:hypothetical protein